MTGYERILDAIHIWNGQWNGVHAKIEEIEKKTGITLGQLNSLKGKSLAPYFINRRGLPPRKPRDVKSLKKDLVIYLNRKQTPSHTVLRVILCGQLHKHWLSGKYFGLSGLAKFVKLQSESRWGSNIRGELPERGFSKSTIDAISSILLSSLKRAKNPTISDIRKDIWSLIKVRPKLNEYHAKDALRVIHFATTGVNPTFIEFLKDGEEFETTFCSPFTYRKYEDRIEKADGSVSYDLECFYNVPVFVVER